MPSLVRDGFGPTLPELIAARTGRPQRRVRAVLFALLALAVLVAGGIRFAQHEAAKGEVVVERGGAFAFNLTYDGDRLVRQDAKDASGLPRERLRLVSKPDAATPLSYVVRERTLPPYTGDVNGFLPLYASAVVIPEMQRFDPGFVERSEGRTRINLNPGYQIVFQTKIDGRTAYGKRILLYDDPDDDDSTLNRPRVIAEITLISGRSPAIPNADAVGGNGALKNPLRSFRFGTERP